MASKIRKDFIKAFYKHKIKLLKYIEIRSDNKTNKMFQEIFQIIYASMNRFLVGKKTSFDVT